MKKIIFGIFLLLIIIGCSNKEVILDEDTTKEESPDTSTTNYKSIECLPEQRDIDGCIEIYQPVCATVNIQCITTPCNPVKETFENSCKACVNPLVSTYSNGKCANS